MPHVQKKLITIIVFAVSEEAIQRFGPPTQCAEAGSTKTCTWIYGSGGTVFMPIGANVVALPVRRPSVRLTFTNNV